MKKSVLLLGAFVLLIAAPSFGQVKTTSPAKTPQEVKANPAQEKKTVTIKEKPLIKKEAVKKEELKNAEKPAQQQPLKEEKKPSESTSVKTSKVTGVKNEIEK